MMCSVLQNIAAAVLVLALISHTILHQVVGANRPRKKLQPTFLPSPTNVTVHRGALAVLQCHIQDLGTKTVVWRKNTEDVPLTLGQTVFAPSDEISIDMKSLSEHKSRWDLIIKDVNPSHEGTYLCQVSASKLYTRYVTLNVLDSAVKHEPVVVITGTEYVNQDDSIRLLCNATGGARVPDDVDWFFKGERIVTTQRQWYDRTQITKRKEGRSFVSELIIDRTTNHDMGNYVCRSSDLSVNSLVVHVLSDMVTPGESNWRRPHLENMQDVHALPPGKDNVSRREPNEVAPHLKVSGSDDLQPPQSSNTAVSSLDSVRPAFLICLFVSIYTFRR